MRRSKTDQQGQGQDDRRLGQPRRSRRSARSPRSTPGSTHRRTAPDLDWTATATVARRAAAVLRRHQGRPGHRRQHCPTRRSPAWSSRPRCDAGLDPERYSGHSLRAGLATAAGDAGAGLAELMRQTRHKSTEVALGYLRPADLWRNNVTEGVFRPKSRGKD